MSCVACGKALGFSSDGAKFCAGCGDAVHKQRKCEIPGCKSSTEAFYTHCTFHYHRLQRELRLIHSRRPRSPPPPLSAGQPRPYRSTNMAPAVPVRRHVSRSSSPAAQASSAKPRQTAQRAPSKPEPPTPATRTVSPPPIVLAKTEVTRPETPVPVPPEPSSRRILKRADPTESTECRKRLRQPTNPHVIVEYECGACSARNVVTREVRFLQTFVVRDNVGSVCDFPAATVATPAQLKFTRTQADADAEREVEDILNCKDAGADDCQFQVNITNAVAAAAATAATK